MRLKKDRLAGMQANHVVSVQMNCKSIFHFCASLCIPTRNSHHCLFTQYQDGFKALPVIVVATVGAQNLSLS